jgi:hypothetical protein
MDTNIVLILVLVFAVLAYSGWHMHKAYNHGQLPAGASRHPTDVNGLKGHFDSNEFGSANFESRLGGFTGALRT